MQVYSLGVEAKEQTLSLSNDLSIEIKFDPFYYRWYANYYKEGELIVSGIALDPDTFGCLSILSNSCGLYDTGDPKVEYEPYEQLGDRLAVIQIDNE